MSRKRDSSSDCTSLLTVYRYAIWQFRGSRRNMRCSAKLSRSGRYILRTGRDRDSVCSRRDSTTYTFIFDSTALFMFVCMFLCFQIGIVQLELENWVQLSINKIVFTQSLFVQLVKIKTHILLVTKVQRYQPS